MEVIKDKVSFWVKSKAEQIQKVEDDPPTQEERKKSNLKKLRAWSITAGLSLLFIIVGLIANSMGVIPEVMLVLSILLYAGSLLLPIALILILFYTLEHFAIKKNKTIFTPTFLKTLGNISIAFSIIGAFFLLAQIAVLITFILSIGGAELFTQLLLFLTYLLVLGVLAMLYYFTLIFSISTSILSAKKTRPGRISIVIMAIALVLTILLFALTIFLMV